MMPHPHFLICIPIYAYSIISNILFFAVNLKSMWKTGWDLKSYSQLLPVDEVLFVCFFFNMFNKFPKNLTN